MWVVVAVVWQAEGPHCRPTQVDHTRLRSVALGTVKQCLGPGRLGAAGRKGWVARVAVGVGVEGVGAGGAGPGSGWPSSGSDPWVRAGWWGSGMEGSAWSVCWGSRPGVSG